LILPPRVDHYSDGVEGNVALRADPRRDVTHAHALTDVAGGRPAT